jgi:hypothetical protein
LNKADTQLTLSRAKRVLVTVTACEGLLYEGSDKRPKKFAMTLALDLAAYVQLREGLTKLRGDLFNVVLSNRPRAKRRGAIRHHRLGASQRQSRARPTMLPMSWVTRATSWNPS